MTPHPHADKRKLRTPVYLCICLHIANVGGICQFSLMSFLPGAPNADLVRLRFGSARIVIHAQEGQLCVHDGLQTDGRFRG
jgi:hypothetical protein